MKIIKVHKRRVFAKTSLQVSNIAILIHSQVHLYNLALKGFGQKPSIANFILMLELIHNEMGVGPPRCGGASFYADQIAEMMPTVTKKENKKHLIK